MATELNPAIELLVSQIEELERKANAFRVSVNILCSQEGRPPIFPDDGGGGGQGSGLHTPLSQGAANRHVRPDTFYGKPQQTAVRELLAMRKTSGEGPAKPAELLEGLKAGGYQVEAKSDEIALVGLRAMLRKRISVFHKLPNGTWGLREWYPAAKAHKETDKGASAGKPDATASAAAEPASHEEESVTEAA